MSSAIPENLVRLQHRNFGLTEGTRLTSSKSAERFLKKVGIALRYWRSEKIPLASLYQAVMGSLEAPPKEKGAGLSQRDEVQRIAIELTNHLLASHQAIEVNTIADRIAFVHRLVVPALYVLVRNHRAVEDLNGVSSTAKKVFHFIEESRETTAGLVRKFLGMPVVDLNNDPAYNALAELQRNFLVDRGPFQMRKGGIPYLSKEGYPYHCFHLAHADLAAAAAKISRPEAAQRFVFAYLNGDVFASEKKMTSLFGDFMPATELRETITALQKQKKISTLPDKKELIWVAVNKKS